MTRRTWTLLLSIVLVLALGLVGGFVRVPYVALGPGPTYDTLSKVGGVPVVELAGHESSDFGGHLTMTTVGVTDGVTVFGALGLWAGGRFALVPREEVFPPEKTKQQVDAENTRAFQLSQTNAEVAALRYLKYPDKVVVTSVTADGPSTKVIQPGDRIVAINGQPVSTADEVRAALVRTKPGDQVAVRYQRNDVPETTAQVTLGERPEKGPDRPAYGFLGVTPADRPAPDFQIKISLKEVGGPSAGLMFALAIVDKLTPGKLNGGLSVAGTGEIDIEGKVGAIGGIPFKMRAAREQGATVFLTPAENCVEARQRVPEGLRLIKVENLAGAVDALQAVQEGKPTPGC
ncbi:PDZ domain-containing protein [Allokutzneria multivorans]|uniref:endopeptidase La n=1 Tax=Allokutzneria multivorans TaxID=1142134 RepID=A0ABP7TUB5_9PSEU